MQLALKVNLGHKDKYDQLSKENISVTNDIFCVQKKLIAYGMHWWVIFIVHVLCYYCFDADANQLRNWVDLKSTF